MAAEVKDPDLVVVIAKGAEYVLDGHVVEGYLESSGRSVARARGCALLHVRRHHAVAYVVAPTLVLARRCRAARQILHFSENLVSLRLAHQLRRVRWQCTAELGSGV